MKKIICMLALGIAFIATPCYAAPGGSHGGHGGPGMGRPPMHGGISMGHRPPMGRPPMHGGGMHRPPVGPPHHIGGRPLPPPPPLYRPYYRPFPVYRPYYYSSVYYPSTYYTTTYTTYPATAYETVTPITNTVVVRDNYAGINTAANVINAAANVAATIRYLTW